MFQGVDWLAIQDGVAGFVYAGHSGAYWTLAAAVFWYFLQRHQNPTAKRMDWTGRVMLCWLAVTSSDAMLSSWFMLSRWLGRPEWMFYSWAPIGFRAMGMLAMTILIAHYLPTRKIAAVGRAGFIRAIGFIRSAWRSLWPPFC